MISPLKQLQYDMCRLTARLIDKAIELGHLPRLGEALRTPEQAALNAKKGTGSRNSLHQDRLAIDLLLDNPDGTWYTDTEHYRTLGEWWKQQHPAAAWGGDFRTRPDGNHFSLSYEGRR